MNLHGQAVVIAGLGLWVAGACLFIVRSPDGAFTHDLRGHLEHTRILYNERRLAAPREGWETYQPPLYYMINTLFSPNERRHMLWVRLLSVFYGTLTLLWMSRLLTRCDIAPPHQALVLFWIATTPAFLFLFTTYNNDSLATLLSIGILDQAWEWVSDGERRSLILLGVLATAGLYTKLTLIYPISALLVVLGYLSVSRHLPKDRILPIFAVFGISFLLLAPWLVGHNYRLTGELTPAPADFPLSADIRLPSSPLKTFLTPPGWTRGEWKDPYAHVWERTNNKKASYLAYLFATSIFGEYTFEFLPPIIPWAMVVVSAMLWTGALLRVRKSGHGRLSLAFIGLGVLALATLFFRAPYVTLMDFRYIAWVWLPMAVLLASCLTSVTFFRSLLFCGIVLNGTLWLALVAGGQWNLL
jgi:hypothetical protein